MTIIIDGKATAADLRGEVASAVRELAERGILPGLAVVLAGEDPASAIYVRNKGVQAREAGLLSREIRLPVDVTQAELLREIDDLNRDRAIHGILVQLPLPAGIDPGVVLGAIDPAKDVDGFHPVNVGRLASGQSALTPCTPLGCVLLLKQVHPSLRGMNALIVGRSNIVGKPLAQLLLREDCTVTIAHRHSADLPALCRSADILVAAVGVPGMIRGDWVRPGASVIDVGINRLAQEGQRARIVGDVAFDEAALVAGAITPVPGGVGPMTIACLLINTVVAACAAHRTSVPDALAARLPRDYAG